MTANYHLHSTIRELLKIQNRINIVQVGANDGYINDPIYPIIKEYKDQNKILLIEPQENILQHLRNSYSFHRNATIFNGAVGPDGIMKLYRLKPQLYEYFIKRHLSASPPYRVPSGFTSSNKDHVLNHIKGNLQKEIIYSNAIEEIEVQSHSLKKIIEKSNCMFEKIDLLQVDAEGMDDIVIYYSNIFELKPTIINFEYAHLKIDSYNLLRNFLNNIGYSVNKSDKNNAMARKI